MSHSRHQMSRVSPETIQAMQKQGAPKEDISWLKETQYSMDANDVARHREYILDYNRADPWREPNNFVMHPGSYTFGTGHRSPEYIGGMLSTMPLGAVNIAGPQFLLPQPIAPFVCFNGQPYAMNSYRIL